MRRRERLAHRADREHPLGREALQHADRVAVVAELGVVVVLDDEAVGVARPRDQRVAPLGGEHHAGRGLVGRRHHDHLRAGGGERVDVARRRSSTGTWCSARPIRSAAREDALCAGSPLPGFSSAIRS